MSTIISIASHKGGVGKTSTVLNLGVSLATAGHRVLLIDATPQCCLSTSVGMKNERKAGLLQLIRGQVQQSEITLKAQNLPLTMVHLGIQQPSDFFYFSYGKRKQQLAAIKLLIKSIAANYDFTLIDTANNIGPFNTTILSCADSLIIPLPCKTNSVKPLPLLLNLIQQIKNKLNPDINLLGILLQMLDVKNPYEMEILTTLKGHFPRGTFFSTYIPYSTQIEKAESQAVPVTFVAEAKEIRQAYNTLTQEVIQRLDYVSNGGKEREPSAKLF